MIFWEEFRGGTLVTVASASTLQTGLLQRCVIWRSGSGGGRPSEQLGEPCMRCVRTGVTDYCSGWKVSLVRCVGGLFSFSFCVKKNQGQ